MKASEQLAKVKELIRDPAHWTRGSYAIGPDGMDVPPRSARAVAFCLAGACKKVEGPHDEWAESADRYLQLVIFRSSEIPNYIRFNDNHTHAEVLELIDRAIALAREDERANL